MCNPGEGEFVEARQDLVVRPRTRGSRNFKNLVDGSGNISVPKGTRCLVQNDGKKKPGFRIVAFELGETATVEAEVPCTGLRAPRTLRASRAGRYSTDTIIHTAPQTAP